MQFKAVVDKENSGKRLIFQSDRCVQYNSYDFQYLLKENRFIQSMSSKGGCYYSACAETSFSSLKKDTLYGRKFEARSSIVEYIELFYNSRILYSTLGYKSPKEYKRDYYNELKYIA